MITEAEVINAEVGVIEANVTRAEALDALDAAPYSDLFAANLAKASKLAAQKGAAARDLRRAFEAQQSAENAVRGRATLEKAAASQIAAADEELGALAKTLATRAGAVQKALADLMAEVDVYNGALAAHSAALSSAGLALAPGGQSATGAAGTTTGPVVVVKGRRHEAADPGFVAAWVTHRVGEARLPSTHPALAALRFFPGRTVVQEQAGTLFPGLAQPEKVVHVPVQWPRTADFTEYGKFPA